MGRKRKTKILFIDNDEMSFAIRQCIARAITNMPPVELFHAAKASDAIEAIDSICPDVIVVDECCIDEFELLRDNFSSKHLPILLQSNRPSKHAAVCSSLRANCIEKSASIDGLRRTIVAATDLAHGRTLSEISVLH